jgi:hypothetical protein
MALGKARNTRETCFFDPAVYIPPDHVIDEAATVVRIQRFEIDGPFWELFSLKSWEEREPLKESWLFDSQNSTYCREYVNVTDIMLKSPWNSFRMRNNERD